MNQDATVTQMVWQPALIQLTAVRTHDVPECACFVNPQIIDVIQRSQVNLTKEGDETISLMATWVGIGAQRGLWVTENPEIVASMRDAAFGYRPKLRGSP